MKLKGIAIFVLLAAIGSMATTAYAQAPTPTSGFDPHPAAAGLIDPAFWVTLCVTLIAGCLGGVARGRPHARPAALRPALRGRGHPPPRAGAGLSLPGGGPHGTRPPLLSCGHPRSRTVLDEIAPRGEVATRAVFARLSR